MKDLTLAEIKTLSDFFNYLSIAWFTAAAATPLFSPLPLNQKVLSFLLGAIGAYLLLLIALFFARNTKR